YSSLTGGRIETSTLTTAYWVDNLRHQVRFSTAVEAVLADGYRVLIEASPHPVLAVGVRETTEALGVSAVVVPTLQRDQGGPAQLARALGQAFTAGLPVDWSAWLGADPDGPPPPLLDLPTYAFQRQRYWPAPARAQGDVATAGMRPVAHGLLSAAVGTADGGLILTGRLPAGPRSGWLREHEVAGTVLLPASVITEWLLRAADEVGCTAIDELVLHTPVVLDETEGLRVQVSVGPATAGGAREVGVYSAPDDGVAGGVEEWVCHATGTLSSETAAPEALAGQWPPPGAKPLDVTDCYGRAAAAGFAYGPAFQGLRAAWSHAGRLYADVALPPDAGDGASQFGIHPALLDAVLHPLLLLAGEEGEEQEQAQAQVWMPFAWTGVSLHAVGATTIRVMLSGDDSADAAAPGQASRQLRVIVADAVGTPVLSVRSVVLRPSVGRQMSAGAAGGTRGLYALDLVPLPEAAGGAEAPAPRDWAVLDGPLADTLADALAEVPRYPGLDALTAAAKEGQSPAPPVVLTGLPPFPDEPGADALDAARHTLDLAADWLARDALAASRLVIVAPDGRAVSPAGAGAWGAIRGLQAEHQDRFVLLDLDDTTPDETTLTRALASGEPELAVRDGKILAPRLAGVRAPAEPAEPAAEPVNAWGHLPAVAGGGTVLIGAGPGTPAELVAEHLVRTGQARRLLLAVPPESGGASGLVSRLTEAGAEVTVAEADLTDAAAVAALLAGIDPRHPLTGVLHAPRDAGWRGAAAARELHLATAGLPLALFAVFTHAAPLLGDPGDPAVAASEAYLAALMAQRRADGGQGLALAWGPWAADAEAGAAAYDARRGGAARFGVRPLTTRQLPALFDAAVRQGSPHLVAARVDARTLSGRAPETLPAALRSLAAARPAARTASAAQPTDWEAQLAGLPEAEQHRVLVNFVRAQAAAVLGESDPSRIEPERGFLDIGIDSLTAVELRDRLASATGLRLPPTLVFDNPHPSALARHLHAELAPQETDPLAPLLAEIDRLERGLLAVAADEAARAQLLGRLRKTTSKLAGPGDAGGDGAAATDRIQGATADEILDFIDTRLGKGAGI
ncbi:polyketide synthase dehydratase domain-containing protein, partial [Streptomyces sparsogenes]|uniref:polyketide synthase dehydratase domain-containing protein n=1 Tax=Streptomyces sparsogenes TaxID=67365 RepID=UPI00331FA635